MGASWPRRWAVVALLYGWVLLTLWLLPETAPLRRQLGGSLAEWLLPALAVALIWPYRRGLAWARARATGRASMAEPETFTPAELERYARHVVLREIGGAGQQRLKRARVLVVGAGGLGSPALLYLAAAGVGTIGVIDGDLVDNSNLQRQVIHTDARIGMPKVFSAEEAMRAQNPAIAVRPYHRRLTEDIAAELIGDYDLVLDGTDNFDTRYLVNRTCARTATPLIAAALSQWEGQISVYDPAGGTPCYQCIFPQAPAPGLAPSCAEAGVLGPLPGVMGAMMAVEAIKEITGAGEALRGRMLIYDALFADARLVKLKPGSDCPVCAGLAR